MSERIQCYAVVPLEGSAEGLSLFASRMAFGPESIRAFVVSRFEVNGSGVRIVTEGDLHYEAGTPLLVERTAKLSLYGIEVLIARPKPPKAAKTLRVDIKLSDLNGKDGLIQPGLRAIETAAKRVGWKAGRAWIVRMERLKSGLLRAEVGLSK